MTESNGTSEKPNTIEWEKESPAVQKLLAELLGNDKTRKATMAALQGDGLERIKKPTNWNANAPYYKKEYAQFVKLVFDEMMKDGEPRLYSYASFPEIQPNTLYNQINQAIRFLVDNMDETGDYKNFLSKLKIHRSKEKGGIILEIRKDVVEVLAGHFMPIKLTDRSNEWREKLTEFIDDETTLNKVWKSESIAPELHLTADEMEGLQTFLDEFNNNPDVIFSLHSKIEHNKIVVIKLDKKVNQ